jgi:thioredoxin-disulfide reductase
MIYDLIIIGGGPAGVAAAIYAGRKKLKTLLVAETMGGQSVVSDEIQNWVGHKTISGPELAISLEQHARAQESIEIKLGKRADKIEKAGNNFSISFGGESAEARAVIIASGSHRRKLNVPGEPEYAGKGVMYCATCDAPMFGGKKVVVVGGGNAGLEAAHDLMSYADKIYLLVRSNILRGDAITQELVKASPKVEIIFNTDIKAVYGEKFVKGLRYFDKIGGKEVDLSVDGVFVEIGSEPNSDLVKGLLEINPAGEIVVNHRTQETNVPGIFAAGDVTDAKFKQNNIAAGDAIKAALSAYDYVCKCAKG